MKIYHSIMNYSKLFSRGKLLKQTLNFKMKNQMSKISSIDHDRTTSGDFFVSKLLDSFKVPYKNQFTCLLVRCGFCNNTSLYINKITGWFICTHCLRYGDWSIFKSHVNKNNERICIPTPKIFEAGKDFKNKADNLMHFKSLKTSSKKSILKSLNLEKLKIQDLDRIPGLYVNSENSSLYLTMMLDNKIVVGYKEIKLENSLNQKTVPDDCCWGIARVPPFTSNHSQSAIIVDDFKHLLVLAGHQSSHHIICLPHGVRKLPQELLPSLEYFNILILWFGNDQIAWNSARTFAKKLIENRCYFIRPTDDQPSPYLAFKLGLNIDKILKTADKMVHPSIIQFSTIRNEVYAELQNHDKTLGMKWTKFPALNKIIGGHRRGELTLLTGPTGSGKTTFISEYSLDLAEQGLPTLWGSFEIRNQRLAKIMLQQFAKEPVHLNLDLFDNLADQFEKLPLYFLTFHGPQPLNIVMDAVVNAVYVYDIGHVIIDNVQFMMGIGAKYDMGSERFWQQDSIIAEFRRFATYSNCHVTLVMHPRKEKDVEQLSISSIFGTAKATQEADNILIIQNKIMESLQIKKYLQVSKNRYSGNLGVMSLEFNKQSLSFSQQKT
ncbi:hypothetical protein QTP88_014719 [Uroleucon formosanum]